MGSLSIWHWIVLVVVLALLFWRGNISELLDDMARCIDAFRGGRLSGASDVPDSPGTSRTPDLRALLFVASAIVAGLAIWGGARLAN